jgi:hypothetical protein
MMCHFEGDIVNSLYDTFLISWGKKLEPALPCISTPAAASREFHFGRRDAHIKQNGADGQNEIMQSTHADDQHASDPAHEIQDESEHYDKENHAKTTIPITERLDINKPADATIDSHELDSDFTPFYLHSPHDPVPMALVNRQPQAIPGHHDVHNPQNAAWLQGTSHLY